MLSAPPLSQRDPRVALFEVISSLAPGLEADPQVREVVDDGVRHAAIINALELYSDESDSSALSEEFRAGLRNTAVLRVITGIAESGRIRLGKDAMADLEAKIRDILDTVERPLWFRDPAGSQAAEDSRVDAAVEAFIRSGEQPDGREEIRLRAAAATGKLLRDLARLRALEDVLATDEGRRIGLFENYLRAGVEFIRWQARPGQRML